MWHCHLLKTIKKNPPPKKEIPVVLRYMALPPTEITA
jgi:hypothetical protein